VAKDEDDGNNAKVNYNIVSGNKSLFHVDLMSGTLSSESLNFEDTREDTRAHVLRIKATDHGNPPRSSFTTVKVLVKDVNDPPKFESNEITGTVS
jgi:protocadherin Fat 4